MALAAAIVLAAAGAGVVGAERYLAAHPAADVFDLHFGFGPLAESLVERGEYASRDFEGVVQRAHRLPLVPLLLAAWAAVSPSLWFVFVAKNLTVAALLVAVLPALGRLAGGRPVPVATCSVLAFGIPYNANKIAALEVEEAYLAPMLFAWFVLWADALRRERGSSAWAIAGLLAACLLTKSSMLACTVAAGVLAAIQFRHGLLRWLPLAAVVLAALAWAGFTWSQTGRPAVLQDMSSWNGWNAYKGNNAVALEHYPEFDLDILVLEGKLPFSVTGDSEWEKHDRYLAMARRFIGDHPAQFAELLSRKAFTFFVDVRPVGRHTVNVARHGESGLDWLLVSSMVLGRILLLGALGHAVWTSARRGADRRLAVALLVFTAAYAAPYVVGFAYYRHVVPLVPVACVYWLCVAGGRPRPHSAAAPGPSTRR